MRPIQPWQRQQGAQPDAARPQPEREPLKPVAFPHSAEKAETPEKSDGGILDFLTGFELPKIKLPKIKLPEIKLPKIDWGGWLGGGNKTKASPRRSQEEEVNWIVERENTDPLFGTEDVYPPLVEDRARYNRTGDPAHLDKYLPYRDSIKGDPQKLARYDAMVEKVMDKAEFILTDQDMPMTEFQDPEDVSPIEMDDSMKYLLAAKLVDNFGGNELIVDELLDKHKTAVRPLTVVITTQDIEGTEEHPHGVNGYAYGSENRYTVISTRALNGSMNSAEDGWDTYSHELIHLIDDINEPRGPWMMDGMPPGLSRRDRLALSRIQDHGMKDREFEKRFGSYGQTNRKEFLGETTEAFFEKPHKLFEYNPELYAIYSRAYNRDPLNYMPAPPEVKGVNGGTSLEDWQKILDELGSENNSTSGNATSGFPPPKPLPPGFSGNGLSGNGFSGNATSGFPPPPPPPGTKLHRRKTG